MRYITGFALIMWLLVVSRSSDYWLGIPPRLHVTALMEVKVCQAYHHVELVGFHVEVEV